MFTLGSFTGEDNPSRAIARTIRGDARGPRSGKPGIDTWTMCTFQSQRPERGPGRLRANLATATGVAAAYLTAFPRRVGDRVFAMNDAEAYWRGWQTSKLHGGLTRRYRDPAFDEPNDSREGAELDEAG